MSTEEPTISREAVDAAITTSSTWPIRDEEGKARYRHRVEVLLEAAYPALRNQIISEVLEQIDPVELAANGTGYLHWLLVEEDADA